jgi:hypothetical protein
MHSRCLIRTQGSLDAGAIMYNCTKVHNFHHTPLNRAASTVHSGPFHFSYRPVSLTAYTNNLSMYLRCLIRTQGSLDAGAIMYNCTKVHNFRHAPLNCAASTVHSVPFHFSYRPVSLTHVDQYFQGSVVSIESFQKSSEVPSESSQFFPRPHTVC